MVHNMKLNEGPFEAIKAGTKTIEMRLYDSKRRKIQVGDVIEFKNVASGEEIRAEVLNLHVVPTFKELYNMFDQVALGYADYEIALHTDMEQYYLVTDIEKYGVVGIEIRLV